MQIQGFKTMILQILLVKFFEEGFSRKLEWMVVRSLFSFVVSFHRCFMNLNCLFVSESIEIWCKKDNLLSSILFRLFALRTWFLERNNFTYGSHRNDINIIGHYTQMIWASSHKVGCGLAKCARGGPRNKPFFNYVCNYCPMWVAVISIRTR